MGRYSVHLVGESNYQAAVKRLRAGAGIRLLREPDNRHDPDAIVALAPSGEPVGYVERGSWLQRAIVQENATVSASVLRIIGGGRGEQRGVLLEVLTAGDAITPVAPAPTVAPSEPADRKRRQNGIGCGLIIVVLLALAYCSQSSVDTAPAPAPAVKLAADVVAKCRNVIREGENSGVIKRRPYEGRIDVEDILWAALPAETKDQVMQAVACDTWQVSTPGDDQRVVAYGFRSGKRLMMLTSHGMMRE